MKSRKMVFVYEKDVDTIKHFRAFFKKQADIKAEFIHKEGYLEKRLSSINSNNHLCIISSGELRRVKPLHGCNVIASITGKIAAGIRDAARYGVDNYILNPFYPEDIEYKIRDTFKRLQTIEDLRNESRDLQALIELTKLVSSTLDPQEILYLIVKKISELIPVTRCSIIRIDSNNRYADVVATFENPKLKSIRLDLNRYPEIKKALTSMKPVIIKNVGNDPLMSRVKKMISPLGIRSIIVIPIIFHEEVIGTLFLRTSRSNNFTQSEIELCHAIANTSANSLYNAFLFEKIESEKTHLEKLAITDFLTGIYNIRYFYHRLTEEFSRSQRYNLQLSCLMIDLDHFKTVNDIYGHKTGDDILVEFAKLLKKQIRKSDVLARYGGEEFIILLLQTSGRAAVTKAKSLRALVERHKFRSLKGKGRITISIGVSAFPCDSISMKDDLITRADDALYKAKAKGRNMVVFDSPKTCS